MGNITSKSDVGNYSYGISNNHPASLLSIDNKPNTISGRTQNVKYTSFNKIKKIYGENSNDPTLDLYYNVEHNRMKEIDSLHGSISRTKVYFGGTYEKITDESGVREIHYISGGDGLTAIIIKKSDGSYEIDYVHKDIIGSIQCITNTAGNLIEEDSYDPWGAKRNPDNWLIYNNPPVSAITDFGYTGQEQLNQFSLINMGGRVYDPIIGRFTSVDPAYANSNNFAGLNAYSYCLNNPLSFTDPSGKDPVALACIIALAVWNGWMSTIMSPGHQTLSGTLTIFGTSTCINLISGLVSMGFAGPVISELGGPCFINSAIGAAAAFPATYVIQSIGNDLLYGDPKSNWSQLVFSFAQSVLTAGISGAEYADYLGHDPMTGAYTEINFNHCQMDDENALLAYQGTPGTTVGQSSTASLTQYNNDSYPGTADYVHSVISGSQENLTANSNIQGQAYCASNGQLCDAQDNELGGITVRQYQGIFHKNLAPDIYVSSNIATRTYLLKILGHEDIHCYHDFTGFTLKFGDDASEYVAHSWSADCFSQDSKVGWHDYMRNVYLQNSINSQGDWREKALDNLDMVFPPWYFSPH
jgi:RHS repeat-associated protein